MKININLYFKYILSIIIIIIIFILFLITYFKIIVHSWCRKFKDKSNNYYANLVRETQLYADCNIIPSFSIKKTIYTSKHNIFGVITQDNILVLKGTDDIYEILMDGLTNKKKFYNGYIHKGAYLIFKEIINQIEDYHIDTICGWSLGSMVGVYIGYYIYYNKNYKTNLILFGCLPTGDLQFKIMYDEALYDNTIVINNKNDFIAFPFIGNYYYNIYLMNKLFNYYHVGNYIKPGLNYKYNIVYNNIFKYHMSYF